MIEPKHRVLVFASGSKDGGGSGFTKLVQASRRAKLPLNYDVVGVVSNYEFGGVRKLADEVLHIPFYYFPKPQDAAGYQKWAIETGADFFALSGWLKHVDGLDPRKTFNIHPGPLPKFGGLGMYGNRVHEAVMEAFHRGEVTYSEVNMHFVVEGYDRGPVFFKFHVKIREDDTAETLGHRVNQYEHLYQPEITNLVVTGQISWDGVDPKSLKFPEGYKIDQYE